MINRTQKLILLKLLLNLSSGNQRLNFNYGARRKYRSILKTWKMRRHLWLNKPYTLRQERFLITSLRTTTIAKSLMSKKIGRLRKRGKYFKSLRLLVRRAKRKQIRRLQLLKTVALQLKPSTLDLLKNKLSIEGMKQDGLRTFQAFLVGNKSKTWWSYWCQPRQRPRRWWSVERKWQAYFYYFIRLRLKLKKRVFLKRLLWNVAKAAQRLFYQKTRGFKMEPSILPLVKSIRWYYLRHFWSNSWQHYKKQQIIERSVNSSNQVLRYSPPFRLFLKASRNNAFFTVLDGSYRVIFCLSNGQIDRSTTRKKRSKDTYIAVMTNIIKRLQQLGIKALAEIIYLKSGYQRNRLYKSRLMNLKYQLRRARINVLLWRLLCKRCHYLGQKQPHLRRK